MEERFVFSGSLGEYDRMGDYAVVLNYLKDRRNNLGFGVFFLILFALILFVQISGGDWGQALFCGVCLLLIIANQLAVASGSLALRHLRRRQRDRERCWEKGAYFAEDLNWEDPITLTFTQGRCRLVCGRLEEDTPCRRFSTVRECPEAFLISGYKMVDIVVPKAFLAEGTMEGFRRFLQGKAKRWYDFEIPEKFAKVLRQSRRMGLDHTKE